MAVSTHSVTADDKGNLVARQIAVAVLLTVLGPAVLWLTYHARFQGLVLAEAMDDAQLARNIANGRGFVTSVVSPLGTNFGRDLMNHTDLTHAPLFPVISAAMFGALGAKDSALALTSAVFFLLTIPLVYLLALRVFGRRTAFVSTLLYIVGERMIQYALSGTSITLLGFLVTATALALHRCYVTEADPNVRSSGLRACAVVGILIGLCYLTDYAFALAALPIGIYLGLSRPRRRAASVLAFATAFILTAGPWMLRNYKITGHPVAGLRTYELVMNTGKFPAFTVYRSAEAKPILELLSGNGGQVAKKWLAGVQAMYDQVPLLAGGWITALFLAGLLHVFRRQGADGLRAALLAMLAVVILMSLLLTPRVDLLVPFVPFATVLAAAFLMHMLNILRLTPAGRTAAVTAVVLIAAFPTVVNITTPSPVSRDIGMPVLMALRNQVPRQTVVATDVPWAVAWYSRQTCVWLPKSEDDFTAIDKLGRVSTIYLSPTLARYPQTEAVGDWLGLQRRAALQLLYRGRQAPGAGQSSTVTVGKATFAAVGGQPEQGAVVLARTGPTVALGAVPER
ncbi:MAG: ArnT family glycosyltransferase [Armatimonadota bacterium]